MPHWAALGVLWLLAWAAFGQAVLHGFVWDDHGLIVHNEHIKTVASWAELFRNSFWQLGTNFEDQTRSFYRPIVSLSYAMEYALWGAQPPFYHVMNILAHGACAWLVYAVGLLFFNRRFPALLAAGIFTVLPVHAENVAWISGRTDIWCVFFYLVACWGYIKWAAQPGAGAAYFALFAVGYLASLLSKEMALSFPMLLLSYYLLCQRRGLEWDKFRWALLTALLITAGYLCIRVATLGKLAGAPMFGTPGGRIASIPMVFTHYLALLSGLEAVDPHHSAGLVTHWASPACLAGLLGSLLAIAVFAFLWRRRQNQAAFFVAWLAITLLPVFNLGTFGDILYADRFLYLPSAGFAWLVALAVMAVDRRLRAAPRTRRWQLAGSILLLVYFGLQIALANLHARYWRDDISLFAHAARTSPDSAYVQYNLGFAYARAKRHSEALAAYAKAIALFPGYVRAYTNMGYSLNELGQFKQALEYLLKARDLRDHSVLLYNNLGDAYRGLGLIEKAMACYRLSLEIQPNDAARNNLGECLLAQGNIPAARLEFLKALRLKPSVQAYNNLGLSCLKSSDYHQAVRYLDQALQFSNSPLEPAQALVIHANLARAQHGLGDEPTAAGHARQAIALMHAGAPFTLAPEIIDQLENLARIQNLPADK